MRIIKRISRKEEVIMTETKEPCLAKIGKYWERADFIGVFQYSYTHGDSPMVGGYKAGQVSYPVAVVRFGGKLYQLKLDEIDFCEVKNEA